jgi:hypothetical protein
MELAVNMPSHVVFVHKSQHQQAISWCRQNLGLRWEILSQTGRWTCFWAGDADYERYRFYFAAAEDAVMFSLKWS